MPDKYICDCGYSSETFVDKCPECGAMMMTIDSDADNLEDISRPEKYEEEPEEENEEMPAMSQRKAT